jgi:hypothetical protein
MILRPRPAFLSIEMRLYKSCKLLQLYDRSLLASRLREDRLSADALIETRCLRPKAGMTCD